MSTISKTPIQQTRQRVGTIFEMPPPELSTFPEALIARTGITFWLTAGFAVGLGLYAIFIVAAIADGYIYQLDSLMKWWYSLTLPLLGTYLLLTQPLLRRLLTQTLESYHVLVTFNDRLSRLEASTYALNRKKEWLSMLVGILVGLIIIDPPFQAQDRYLSAAIFDLVGDVLVFSLVGWHIYAGLARTRLLSTIHDQVYSLTVFQHTISYKYLVRWSVANAGVLLGGIFLSGLFLRPEDMFNTSTVVVYSGLVFLTISIFAFSRVPASVLNQFRVFRAFALFLLIAVIGTVGYHKIEGWELQDSLYATVITMTTIGYGDFSPTTSEGQLFTIILSLFAIGIGGYAVTSVASFVIEGNFHRFIQDKRIDKQILKMHNHYIVCGSGKLGRQLAIEFYKSQVPFVVIEQSAGVLEKLLHEVEIPYVQGDATKDEVLHLAGVERAKGLVAVLNDDKSNVFVSLSARSLNPKLRIISRVKIEKNRKKLEKAGTNIIISPNAVSGRRMASEMFNLEVVTLLDEMLRAEQQTGQTLRLEEVHVSEIKIPSLVERLEQGNLHITDIGQLTELMVVAVKHGQIDANEDPYTYTPRGNTLLQYDDVLIVMGTPEQRIELQHQVLSSGSLETWWARLWA